MLRATSCVLTPSGEIAGHRANTASAEYETDSDEEEGSDSDDEPDYEQEEPVDESHFGDDGIRLPQLVEPLRGSIPLPKIPLATARSTRMLCAIRHCRDSRPDGKSATCTLGSWFSPT